MRSGTGTYRAALRRREHVLDELPVRIGEVRTGSAGSVLFSIGLGSCVAIALYDDVARIGGLAHAMLPQPRGRRGQQQPGRFASTAVPLLVELMEREGASSARLNARLAGGASMFRDLLDSEGLRLGPRNVQAAREALYAAGVQITGEDVLGTHGRSIFLHTADGLLTVTSVNHDDRIL
jgi:chemotaxis protein CheD